jgi:hypothetical protein
MLGHISCLAPIQHDSEQHALRLAARGTRGKGGTAGLGRPTQGDAGGPQGTPDQQGQPVCYSNQSSCLLLAKVSERSCALEGAVARQLAPPAASNKFKQISSYRSLLAWLYNVEAATRPHGFSAIHHRVSELLQCLRSRRVGTAPAHPLPTPPLRAQAPRCSESPPPPPRTTPGMPTGMPPRRSKKGAPSPAVVVVRGGGR